MRQLFDAIAADYDGVIPLFAAFGRRLAELSDLRPGETFLDVGCGRGAALAGASEVAPGAMGVGADLSEAMLALARRSLGADGAAPRLVCADAEHLSLRSASVDVAVVGFALAFLSRPDRGLVEAHRVLRPGGRVVVAFFPDGFGWPWLPEVVRSTLPPPHARPPATSPEAAAVALLTGSGFEVTGTCQHGETFVFPDADRVWRWLHGSAVRTNLDRATAAQRAAFRRGVEGALAAHADGDGRYVLRQQMTAVTARRPGGEGAEAPRAPRRP